MEDNLRSQLPTAVYSYSPGRKLVKYSFVVLMGSAAIFLIATLLLTMIRWVVGDSINTDALIVLPIAILLIGFFPTLFANFEPDIRVSYEGMYVQFFLIWLLFVPWKDVIVVKPSLLGLSRGYQIVLVRRLTFIHRLISFFLLSFLSARIFDWTPSGKL